MFSREASRLGLRGLWSLLVLQGRFPQTSKRKQISTDPQLCYASSQVAISQISQRWCLRFPERKRWKGCIGVDSEPRLMYDVWWFEEGIEAAYKNCLLDFECGQRMDANVKKYTGFKGSSLIACRGMMVCKKVLRVQEAGATVMCPTRL